MASCYNTPFWMCYAIMRESFVCLEVGRLRWRNRISMMSFVGFEHDCAQSSLFSKQKERGLCCLGSQARVISCLGEYGRYYWFTEIRETDAEWWIVLYAKSRIVMSVKDKICCVREHGIKRDDATGRHEWEKHSLFDVKPITCWPKQSARKYTLHVY